MSVARALTPARVLVSLSWVLAVALVGVVAISGTAGAERDGAGRGAGDGIATAEGDGARLQGTLRADGGPVAGVTIRVEGADGDVVAETTTGQDGRIQLALPGPGTYRAVLDPETLPEGVALRDPERATLELTVDAGDSRPLLFPLTSAGPAGAGGGAAVDPGSDEGGAGGEPGGGIDFPTERFAQGSVNGLKLGLLIGITSVGLSLVFGTTRLINFAHGDMVTFGMVVAFLLHREYLDLPLVAAGLLAIVAGAGLGAGMERALWDPLRRRQFGIIQMLVVSIGLSFLLRYLILLVYGSQRQAYADFAISSQVTLGPMSTTVRDLGIMAISVAVLVAVGLMLTRTRVGKAIRAVADNRDLAESSGIDVRRVILFVWILGGALAALGGVLYGASEEVSWLSGFRLLLLMFAGVILGGIGTAFGALVGSLVVGLGVEISAVWLGGQLKYVWALLIMIVVLMVRPQGIMGVRERVG